MKGKLSDTEPLRIIFGISSFLDFRNRKDTNETREYILGQIRTVLHWLSEGDQNTFNTQVTFFKP
ncbi:hypothetical protein [Leptospira noguchii]|uniref:Uncharacterized protein n=1 Tax=Leptospira noguchii str. 2001034031 TaxID=1193053 RepID=M6YC09_9LEPT|nr:hypothetical protein [Leptospira noguchii]EMO89381.1 hypothetical protein LEP1GSC024_1160 [Leptospira noguchii str. 2001034031]